MVKPMLSMAGSFSTSATAALAVSLSGIAPFGTLDEQYTPGWPDNEHRMCFRIKAVKN